MDGCTGVGDECIEGELFPVTRHECEPLDFGRSHLDMICTVKVNDLTMRQKGDAAVFFFFFFLCCWRVVRCELTHLLQFL